MIEQCEKCALYNSLGCPYCGVGSVDSEDCDEYIPNEESKITDPIKKRLFNLLKDSPSLNVLYEEQWTESVEYLVSNGVTLKSEFAREIFEEIEHEMFTCDPDYGRLYRKFKELKKKYTEARV